MIELCPVGRGGTPDEVGTVGALLMGPEAVHHRQRLPHGRRSAPPLTGSGGCPVAVKPILISARSTDHTIISTYGPVGSGFTKMLAGSVPWVMAKNGKTADPSEPSPS